MEVEEAVMWTVVGAGLVLPGTHSVEPQIFANKPTVSTPFNSYCL
jgi:hypothetical protein